MKTNKNPGFTVKTCIYCDTPDGKPVKGAVIAAVTTKGIKHGTVDKVTRDTKQNSGTIYVTLGGVSGLMYSYWDCTKMPRELKTR